MLHGCKTRKEGGRGEKVEMEENEVSEGMMRRRRMRRG